MTPQCDDCPHDRPKTLVEWCAVAHQNSKDHGFHDHLLAGMPAYVPTRQALLHSEVSELFEAFRGDPNAPCGKPGLQLSAAAEELADIVIRLFDFVGEFELDPRNVFGYATFEDCRRACTLDTEPRTLGEEICIMHKKIGFLTFGSGNDAAARLFMQVVHFAKRHGYDLELAVQSKHAYNVNRPHMHGKKF